MGWFEAAKSLRANTKDRESPSGHENREDYSTTEYTENTEWRRVENRLEAAERRRTGESHTARRYQDISRQQKDGGSQWLRIEMPTGETSPAEGNWLAGAGEASGMRIPTGRGCASRRESTKVLSSKD